jgi:hypothetical protein
MTCSEFRDLTENKSPLECTRGERMSWSIHKGACAECRSWHDTKYPIGTTDPERCKALKDTADADKRDPEFKVDP